MNVITQLHTPSMKTTHSAPHLVLCVAPQEADSQFGSLSSGTTIHILLNTPYTVEK